MAGILCVGRMNLELVVVRGYEQWESMSLPWCAENGLQQTPPCASYRGNECVNTLVTQRLG